MAGVSVWHWLVVIVWITVIVIPAARIMKRMGFSGWWSVLAFAPLLKIAALWMLAFAKWPKAFETAADATQADSEVYRG